MIWRLVQSSPILSIPKGRNINLTESSNYRGIALSSIFGKIFDLPGSFPVMVAGCAPGTYSLVVKQSAPLICGAYGRYCVLC